MQKPGVSLLILLIFIAAASARFCEADLRTMHGDEAVNAVKLGHLLETGDFSYDPAEYHGPTLYYLAEQVATLSHQSTYQQLTEAALRALPAIAGLLLVFMPLLLYRALGLPVALLASLLAAVSPLQIFYSRYFIHEILLVLFCSGFIALLYRWQYKPGFGNAFLAGSLAGLAISTKETWILYAVAISGALLVSARNQGGEKPAFAAWMIQIVVAAVAAAFVGVLFYSSFFSNPSGLADAFNAYSGYLSRAGSDSGHRQAWYYYLMVWAGGSGGWRFGEPVIILLGLAGGYIAWKKPHIVGVSTAPGRFLVVYSFLLLLLFSVVPYKTPWNILGVQYGFLILSSIALAGIWKGFGRARLHMAGRVLVVAAVVSLFFSAGQLNFCEANSPLNPQLYGHPGEDVIAVCRRLTDIAENSAAGYDTRIDVMAEGDDYWPLPWYLRKFHAVGWWNKVPPDLPAGDILIVSPGLEADLSEKLYEVAPPGKRHLFVRLMDEDVYLRPGVPLGVYVKKDILD